MKTITKTALILLLSATFIKAQVNQKWLQLGSGTSKNLTSQPSMAFDKNGNLFLAYIDLSSSPTKATLKKFDGQTWTTLSSQFTPKQASFIKLDLDTAGVPYVAFQEPYPITEQITVMKFNGAGWDTVGTRGFATSNFGNQELSLVINPNNNLPIIAFSEMSGSKASVMGYFGTSWIYINGSSITQGSAKKLALSIKDTSLYLAFSNGAKNDKLSVLYNSTTGWVYSGDTVISAGAVDYVNSKQYKGLTSSYVAVAYKDLTDNKAYIKTKPYTSNTWTTLNNAPLSDGTANYVSLAKKHSNSVNDIIYCGYSDGTSTVNATVKKGSVSLPASTYTLVGKKGFTDTLGIFAAGYYTTLGMDKNDSLYMAVQSFNEYVLFKYRAIPQDLTGISTNNLTNEILIYPNPTEENVTIKRISNSEYSVKLLAIDGKVLSQKKQINTDLFTLDLSEYTQGIYFIEINDRGTITREKIIKK